MTRRADDDYRQWPTATQQIAQHLRQVRLDNGWSQDEVAAVLTKLTGERVRKSTVVRIEAGKQPPTLEQALCIGMLTMPGGGLAAALGSRFRAGAWPVADKDETQVLVGGRVPKGAPLLWEALNLVVAAALTDERDRQLARELDCDTAMVAKAAEDLYGHSARAEIARRTHDRLVELRAELAGESPDYATLRGHAVRQVTAELRERIGR